MRIDRVEVAHGVGVAFYLNFEDGEGMRSVLNLANAIEDGSALSGPATVATPGHVMTLRPAECARGEQNCDDCPELRCGDQLWPVLHDERFAAIADPSSPDQARFDALLSLCYQLRSRNDELVAEVAESVDLRADAVAVLRAELRDRRVSRGAVARALASVGAPDLEHLTADGRRALLAALEAS